MFNLVNPGFQQFHLESVNERAIFFQQMNESINRIQGYLADFSQVTNSIEQRSSSADERHAPLTIEQGLLAICKKTVIHWQNKLIRRIVYMSLKTSVWLAGLCFTLILCKCDTQKWWPQQMHWNQHFVKVCEIKRFTHDWGTKATKVPHFSSFFISF